MSPSFPVVFFHAASRNRKNFAVADFTRAFMNVKHLSNLQIVLHELRFRNVNRHLPCLTRKQFFTIRKYNRTICVEFFIKAKAGSVSRKDKRFSTTLVHGQKMDFGSNLNHSISIPGNQHTRGCRGMVLLLLEWTLHDQTPWHNNRQNTSLTPSLVERSFCLCSTM